MSSYQQQLNKCKDTTDDYSNIWKSKVWTITDYEELFEDIDRGYVIQDPDANYFIINPDWDGEEYKMTTLHPIARIINQSIQNYLWINGDYVDNVDDKKNQYGLDSFIHNGFFVNGF